MPGIWLELFEDITDATDARSECSFCGRGLAALERLITARDDVSICSGCVTRCARALREANVEGWRPWWRIWARVATHASVSGDSYRERAQACSFCSRSSVEVPALLGGGRVNICGPCVRLSVEIIHEDPDGTASESERPT